MALAVAAVVIMLASVALTGCGRRAALRQEDSTNVTTETPSETTTTESDKTAPETIDAAKAKALNDQLSSLEKQLSDVDMPSDSVFNDSASALQ
jgi:predicted small lipoprotein YifL